MSKLNLTNHRYNRWLIIKEVDKRSGKRYFLCRCDCGNEKNSTNEQPTKRYI